MKTGMSRRGFVQTTATTAIIAGLGIPGTGWAQTASDYAAVRARWRRYLTASGVAYSPTAAPYSTYIAGLNSEVAQYISTLDFTNPNLFTDPDVTGVGDYGKKTRVMMGRLRMMAIAYAVNGSAQYGNPTLRDNIIRALGFISANRYYAGELFASNTASAPNTTGPATYSGNQYMWEIGLPQPLLDTLIIMESEIRAKAAGQIPGTSVSGSQLIANYMAAILYHNPDVTVYSGSAAGAANLGWNGQIYLLVGMLKESNTIAQQGLTAIKNSIKDVTTKDGFYPDGSFLQHGAFPYTGSYGLGLLDVGTSSINVLIGSPWALDSASVAKVTQWVTRSFDPVVYRGGIMSIVKGRAVSRSYEQEIDVGNGAAASVITLAEVAPSAASLKSTVKGWLQADPTNSFYTYIVGGAATIYAWYLRETIIKPTSVVAAPEPQGYYQYPLMSRVLHRRPSFSLALATVSPTVANYESIGAEDLRGWYQGVGTTYIYAGTASYYRDAYFPTVDPYRMPGTTVDTRALQPAEGYDMHGISYAGSAGYDGSSVAGMVYGGYLDFGINAYGYREQIRGTEDLVATKSYFFFGDWILCAGVGISDNTTNTVETIIENRGIGVGGTNAVTVNDVAKLTVVGTVASNTVTKEDTDIIFNRTVNQIQQLAPADAATTTWVHVDGVGGYIIPTGNPKLYGVKEDRSGTWQSINNGSGNAPGTFTRRYVTLWLDHGASPQSTGNSTYSYFILPTSGSAAATKASAAAPLVTLVTNTTAVQYASGIFSSSRVWGAMFWTNATVGSTSTSPFITCNRVAAVFIRQITGQVQIAVADATSTSTTPIVVTVAVATVGPISADPGLTVSRTASTVTVTLNPTGTNGLSKVAILST